MSPAISILFLKAIGLKAIALKANVAIAVLPLVFLFPRNRQTEQ